MNALNRQEGGDHYRAMAVQPWEAMEAWLTHDQFMGFLVANVIKYTGRFNAVDYQKGGLMDLKKARHYLDRAIEILEANGQ